jgi:hypothetical protein
MPDLLEYLKKYHNRLSRENYTIHLRYTHKKAFFHFISALSPGKSSYS